MKQIELKKLHSGVRGLSVLLVVATVVLVSLLMNVTSALAQPTKTTTCITNGCHIQATEPSANLVWGVKVASPAASQAANPTSVTVDVGSSFELDVIANNVTWTAGGNSGLSFVVSVPSGWTIGTGTTTGAAPAGWKTVWDQTAGWNWRTGTVINMSSNWANAPDGYDIDWTGSLWQGATTSVAEDRGNPPQANDRDTVADQMGTDVIINVPGGTTPGSYEVHITGIGHNASKKAYKDQLITVVVPDSTKPTVSSFTATTPVNTNVNIPITAFSASDDTAVTGYMVTESATPPASGAAGWTPTAPTTFTSSAGDGTKTLYPWAKDAAGNVSLVYGFPASVVVDGTGPSVATTTPTNGASAVALNGFVIINFNENLNCTTANSTTEITSDSPGWSFNNCSGSQVIFNTSGQAGGTLYTVTVTTAVTDVLGNPISAPYAFSYTTAGGDTTPPTVSSTVPTNGATGVTLDSFVTINFSENINCTTVNTTSITSTSPGWTLNNCATNQAVFNTSGQANGTLYNVNVTTAIKDLAGNSMSAAYPFSYTTVAVANNPPNAPTGLAQLKLDGATPIAVGGYSTEASVIFNSNLIDPDPDTVKLQIDTNSDGTFDCESALVAQQANYKLTCALADGSYNWQARTVDSLGATSSWVAFNAANPDFIKDTSAPTDGSLTPTPGDTQIVLNWTAATDATSGLTSPAYKLVMAAGTTTPPTDCSGAAIYTGDALTHTETGLTNGVDYAFRVCATDNVGLVSSGATATAQPTAAPNVAPTVVGSLQQYQSNGITVLASGGAATNNAVVVEAQVNDVDGDNVIIEVDIDSDSNVDCVSPVVAGSGTPKASCTALADGSYNWQVRAKDRFGNTSGWTAFAGTPDFTVSLGIDIGIDTTPPTESGLAVSPGDTVIDLSWNQASDGSGSGLDPINTYKIVSSTVSTPADCSAAGIYTGNLNSYSDTGLSNGTTYYYRVCAYDNVGNVSAGQTISATPGSACTYSAPTVSILGIDKDITNDGGFVEYTLSVTNGDVGACAATAFDIVIVDGNTTNFYPTTVTTDPLTVSAGASNQTSIRVTAKANQSNSTTNAVYFYTAADGNHAQSANSNTRTTTINVSGGGCIATGSYLNANGDQMSTSR